MIDFEDWQKTDQTTYFEFFKLNRMGDYLNKEQRQRILDVARVMFPNAEKGLYTEEITQRQKEEPWKRTGSLRTKNQQLSRHAGGDGSSLRHDGRPLGASSGGQPGCRICRRLQISSRVSYPIAGRGLLCLGSPAAPGIAVSNVLPVTFSRQFRHKKTPCASTAQGVFS